MDTPNQGTPLPPGQPQQGTPAPAGQPTPSQPLAGTPPPNPAAPQTPASQPGQPQPPPAQGPRPTEPSQPSPAELQLRQQLQQAQEQARFHQSRADRAAQIALGQQQPPPDPAKSVAAQLARELEMDPEDTEKIVRAHSRLSQPLIQQNQQLQQALHAREQVNSVLHQTYTQAPGLFANPTVAHETEQALRQAALQNPQLVTPEYALNIAYQAHGRMTFGQQPQQAPAQPQPAQFPLTQWPGGQAYQPMPSATAPTQLSPAAQEMQDAINQRYSKP